MKVDTGSYEERRVQYLQAVVRLQNQSRSESGNLPTFLSRFAGLASTKVRTQRTAGLWRTRQAGLQTPDFALKTHPRSARCPIPPDQGHQIPSSRPLTDTTDNSSGDELRQKRRHDVDTAQQSRCTLDSLEIDGKIVEDTIDGPHLASVKTSRHPHCALTDYRARNQSIVTFPVVPYKPYRKRADSSTKEADNLRGCPWVDLTPPL